MIEVNGEVHEFDVRERRESDGEYKMQGWIWRNERWREKEGGLHGEMRDGEKKNGGYRERWETERKMDKKKGLAER